MQKLEIIFDQPDPKKHSIRFNTSQEDSAVDSVYVKRSHLGSPAPKRIKVTIEEA